MRTRGAAVDAGVVSGMLPHVWKSAYGVLCNEMRGAGGCGVAEVASNTCERGDAAMTHCFAGIAATATKTTTAVEWHQ